MEAGLEAVRKGVTDLEGRQTVMLLNETAPLKDQLAEIRSTLGVLGMHVRWLMNFRLQERSRAATASGGGGSRGLAGPAGAADTTNAVPSVELGAPPSAAERHHPGSLPRRVSDGLRENPARL